MNDSDKHSDSHPEEPRLRLRHVVQRIGRDLHRVTEYVDGSGKVVERMVSPVMVDLGWRDIAQIVVGASVLCIPVSFTEEVWTLGEELSVQKALLVAAFSLTFVTFFIYLNFYRRNVSTNVGKFAARVAATYFITGTVAALLLFFIDKLPLTADLGTAVKRVILVALPGCFSATVIDSLK
jgi:uncharacterized membrane protein